MIQRYEITDCGGPYTPWREMRKDDTGEYVLFEDHAAETAALRAEVERLECERSFFAVEIGAALDMPGDLFVQTKGKHVTADHAREVVRKVVALEAEVEKLRNGIKQVRSLAAHALSNPAVVAMCDAALGGPNG